MRARSTLLGLLFVSLISVGPMCPPPSEITVNLVSPVTTFSFPLQVNLIGDFVPGSFSASINLEDVTSRFTTISPVIQTATIDPGAPLRDENFLLVRAQRTSDGVFVTRGFPFDYLPPGKASAEQISDPADRIRGPLAHSQVDDWLLANGVARFVVQDVQQRELYSVGGYGGNLIDAELLADPGKDNFIELQPSLNIESVVNAQEVEIVNDGQDGTAAIVRTCGPDDLLDFVNPSSQVLDAGLPFPPLADDTNLMIDACTEYSLAPGDSHVKIDTQVFNNYTPGEVPVGIPDPLPLLVGDWLNPGGELGTVVRGDGTPSLFNPIANGVGPPTASSLGTIGFYGVDEAAGLDYAFTQVPLPTSPTVNGSMVFVSGVLVVLHSQNALATLLSAEPVIFQLPAGGNGTFTRFFGVGDGTASNAFDLENQVRSVATGTLEGCVSVAGAPVAGARVSVGSPFATGRPAFDAASDKLFQHFTTRPGACPNYSGTVKSGSYDAAAALEGHYYVGGASAPPLTPVTITTGATTVADFDLPLAGRLQVNVVDAAGAPIPARITVVGFDQSPEPQVEGPTLPGFGGGNMGLFNDLDDALPYGVVATGYADVNGFTEFDIEPGNSIYHVFVSRGAEYSSFRTAAKVSVTAGSTTVVNAQIARVVDTPGFVSNEFHVHGIRSWDSRVSDLHRVEAYSTEGIENVVMTDHHVHTDLTPKIAETGLGAFLTATIGEEITTFDYGHFNAYPMLIDPNSEHPTFTPDGLTQLSGGSTDWAQAAPAGFDFPSEGALNAIPSEVLNLATTGSLSTASTTVQINHIDSHFEPLKIDTALVPIADALTDVERAGRRLPDTATVPNLFTPFPALELWNGDNRNGQSQFLDERIGIWFNHLNQGIPTTFIADTDSHRFTNLNSAGARTWTASPTDSPAAIDPADVADSVAAGRAVGGQGVYVQTRLLATDGVSGPADLEWGGNTQMTDANNNVVLEIDVQSPKWAEWDRIEIYANAATVLATDYLYGATPTMVLNEGDCDPATTGDGNFDIDVTTDIGGVAGADRWSATLNVPFNGLAADTWFVVVVKGSDGLCEPMFPVYPDDLDPVTNTTLDQLVDSNAGQLGTMALGATNALYFSYTP
jgi:hypothetical protein